MLTSVLSWWWADFDWKNNKVGIFVFPIILAINTILLYHVKQSLVVLSLIPIIAAAVLSIFNNFRYSNVVSKILSLFFVGLTLLYSIVAWGNFMSNTEMDKVTIVHYIKLSILPIIGFVLLSIVGIYLTKRFKLQKVFSVIGMISMFVILGIGVNAIYNHYKLEELPTYSKYIEPEEDKDIKKAKKKINESKIKAKETESLDVLEATNSARVDNRLFIGVFGHALSNENNFEKNKKIDRDKITTEDNIEIDKVLDGKSKYTSFDIYLSVNEDKYFVYFSDDDDGFKKQFDFFMTILVNYPEEVIEKYKYNYWKIIFMKEEDFSPYERENFNIPSKIYTPGQENLVDVNEEYEEYIQEYRCIIEENNISAKLNTYMNKAIHVIINKMEKALWYSPLMLVISVVIYLIVRIFFSKFVHKTRISLIQFIIILYATTFGSIMSYVAFGTTIDRYVIPMTLTAFLAYFLVGLLIVDLIIFIIRKIFIKATGKHVNKMTNDPKQEDFRKN